MINTNAKNPMNLRAHWEVRIKSTGDEGGGRDTQGRAVTGAASQVPWLPTFFGY